MAPSLRRGTTPQPKPVRPEPVEPKASAANDIVG